MATQQANMNKNLPPVSYIKALDVWSGTCLAFIFAALLEYALVNYATRFDKRTKAKNSIGHEPESSGGFLSRRYTSTSKRIDVIARILFPLLFLIFNIVYWVLYLFVLNWMNTTARYFSILGSKYRNLIIDYKQSNFNLTSILATWRKNKWVILVAHSVYQN